jgi:hypothetical protein
MKRILAALLGLIFLCAAAEGQNSGMQYELNDILAHLPTVEFREGGPQHYVFTCDYVNFDLAGNVTAKERVSGDYTSGLPDGKVRWNNVRIAHMGNTNGASPEGVLQRYMENFSYDRLTPDYVKDSFFADFPANSIETKALVWDVSMLEQFARNHFDKLKLNDPFELKSSDISVPGMKFFNRLPRVTWVGVSKMNDKACAVIEYEGFFNKLSSQVGEQTLKGRSDYWGTIWVSLRDKQIEKGTLNEGVLLGVEVSGQAGPQAVPVFRQATLCRRTGREER